MPTRNDITTIGINHATKEQLSKILDGRTPEYFLNEIISLAPKVLPLRKPGQSFTGVLSEIIDQYLADNNHK